MLYNLIHQKGSFMINMVMLVLMGSIQQKIFSEVQVETIMMFLMICLVARVEEVLVALNQFLRICLVVVDLVILEGKLALTCCMKHLSHLKTYYMDSKLSLTCKNM